MPLNRVVPQLTDRRQSNRRGADALPSIEENAAECTDTHAAPLPHRATVYSMVRAVVPG